MYKDDKAAGKNARGENGKEGRLEVRRKEKEGRICVSVGGGHHFK